MKRAVLAAALVALSTPALGGDAARPAVDASVLQQDPAKAKWIFEGCAAYPAGAHAAAPATGAQSTPRPAEAPVGQMARSTPAATSE